jgi:multidrug efflux pump subunit AcrB
MGGISGQYFKSFGLTVAAAVFMSLLVARLITPVMAAYFLKPGGVKPHAEGRTMDWYLRLLKWCIHNRWKTIGGGFAFFVLSIGLMVVIPKGFLPPLDFGFSQVQIELAPGARVEDTARVSAQVTKLLKEQPEVTDVFELIAEDQGEPRTGQLFVTLTDRKERDLTVKEWEQKMAPQLRSIPDARINFQSQGFGGGRDLTVQLTADDPGALERAAAQLEKEMQGSKVMRDARINGDLQRPEVVIKPRFDLAAELGVSVASLSQTIRIATLGDIPQNLAKFSVEDRQVPIRVRLVDEARTDLSTIENLPVPTASGATVPLKSVADITFGQGPSKIRRYNQSRRIVLGADLQPGISLGEGIKALNELPTMKNLPAGVRKVEQGDAEFMGELLSGFVLALTAGTLLVFAVLVLLYKRFFSPLTNMGSLLLAPGGAVILLLLTGYEMTMPVFIGILMLFGIVAKNSILLIDFAIEAMREGVDRDTAIIDAGHKRAQPIVMTTFAMIAGMMPIALGWGADAAFRAPMAIAVIGGLITSTALTLVIVPAAFTVMDDIEKWLAPKFGKRLHHKDMVPAGSAVHTPAE